MRWAQAEVVERAAVPLAAEASCLAEVVRETLAEEEVLGEGSFHLVELGLVLPNSVNRSRHSSSRPLDVGALGARNEIRLPRESPL